MPKNYLLIYSEQIATEIELLCQNAKSCQIQLFRFAKIPAVFMQMFAKLNTDRAKLIDCIEDLLVENKILSPDLGGSVSTCEVGDAVIEKLKRRTG